MRPLGLHEYNPTPFDNAMHVPKKLKILARDKLEMEIQVDGRPHCPIEDAVATLELYKRHRVKWERVIMYKVKRTREICGSSSGE
ncbi:hypothetical protein ACHAW5_008798 [Stephanodiscus triporus]|uniref:Exonuclease domain-containing protein n=1 Tax=Stephanodiscus triporus TaxID=2934178 RepID=A0ABD3MRY3_9STRA